MKTGRYAEGERNRQLIIDYLIDHPGSYGPEILAALNLDKTTGSDRLGYMTNHLGELRRESALYECIGYTGQIYRNRSFRYWAVVTKTRSHTETAKKIASNTTKKKSTKVVEVIDKTAQEWRGGSFKNTRHDRPVTICPDAMRGVGHRTMTYLEANA